MTSAGPEAGWYFDPDNNERERFWNGANWTEHRRALPAIATSDPQMPQSTEIRNPAQTLDPVRYHRRRSATEDERRRAKVRGDSRMTTPSQPKVRKAERAQVVAADDDHYGHIGLVDPSYQDDEHIFLKFEGDQDLYAFEPIEIAPVTGAPTTLSGSSKPEGRRGRHARVVASGDERQGQIGQIDPSYEDEEHVFMRFEGDLDLYAFERNEIEMVVSPPAAPMSTSAPNTMSASPTPDSAPTSRSSPDADELMVGGKAKVVAGDNYLIHHVGRIVSVDDGTVKMKFPGTFGTTTLRRDQVKVVATEHRADAQLPTSPPRDTSDASSLQSWWRGLTGGTRLGIALGALAVLVLLVVSVASIGSSSSRSTTSGFSSAQITPTGTLDDWVAAVCRPGTSGSLAANPILCNGLPEGGGFKTEIFVYQYDSAAALSRDQLKTGPYSYAVCTSADGATSVFETDVSGIGSNSRAAELTNQSLQPLINLGCDITHTQ